MSFLDKYSTEKTEKEGEMELKAKIALLVKNALKATAQEREEGLILTDIQIEKIIEEIKDLNFDKTKKGYSTLEGLVVKTMKNSTDLEIKELLSKSSEIYNKKQEEFKETEEYKVLQEVFESHKRLDIMDKIMTAFNIDEMEVNEDETVDFYCKCDEAKFILPKYNNAGIKIKDGKISIETLEEGSSAKSVEEK